MGATLASSWAAILPSTSATRASALFQRASSSPVTKRLAGSQRCIAGKHGQLHSARLRDHAGGPHGAWGRGGEAVYIEECLVA